jgi:nicotinamidase-related amidase
MSEWKMKGKPGLILVHMQHGVVGQEGGLAMFNHARAAKEAGIIPHQQALLYGFREKKLPIVYVLAVNEPTTIFPAYGTSWKKMESSRANLRGSKDVEVIPELAPQPGEPVISNWLLNSFSNSNLDQILKEYGIETVVIVGVATATAVLPAVIGATDSGYSVIVPKNASISAHTREHEVIMNDILPRLSLVTTAEDVLAHI